jgi:ABC-type Na+ efflux pump permease subunit
MRKLTSREIILLCILLVLVAAGGYIMFFYQPMQQKKTDLEGQIAINEELIAANQTKLDKQNQMKTELEAIFAMDDTPLSLAQYDNIQAVMFELNGILKQTEEYSLNFSTVDTEEKIVRRYISLQFRSVTYESAKQVLEQLHDSNYRCMLDNLDISTGSSDSDISVTATIVFFEYQ